MNEELLAYHCAPALAGIKPSNIISFEFCDGFENDVKDLNLRLNKIGIYIEILCSCEKRVLVMVYRKKQLEEYLHKSEIFEFLKREGYPTVLNLEEYIIHLKRRLSKKCEFPHEIGAFLGYPIYDIYGFINNQKEVFTGYWKVYDNVDDAKILFKRFDRCRKALCKRISTGKSIAEIFGAA